MLENGIADFVSFSPLQFAEMKETDSIHLHRCISPFKEESGTTKSAARLTPVPFSALSIP